MNPPRGDTWASNAGLVAGILFFSWRRRLGGVAFATLGGLLLGGMGFALGGAVKLLVMSSGYDTNWHSILEQSQGFFLGIALAITMGIPGRAYADAGRSTPRAPLDRSIQRGLRALAAPVSESSPQPRRVGQ